MSPRSVAELCARLGLREQPPLMERALTHGSANETGGKAPTNETLAFLGDAVLELAIRHRCWRSSESTKLGDLSIKADVDARNSALAGFAKAAGLQHYIRAGQSDGAKEDSVLASALEAVLGAVYLGTDFAESERVAGLFLDGTLQP